MDVGNNFGGWKELPVDIIWLIMEKLHLTDNIRLAAVCKDFRYVFTTLPTKLNYRRDEVPWLLMINKSLNNEAQDNLDIVRVSTAQTALKLRIDKKLLHHQSAIPLCSRKGWLLAAEAETAGDSKDCYDNILRNQCRLTCLFLLHPITNEKIRMPGTGTGIYRFAISVVHGKPKFVLLADLDQTSVVNTIILRIWRPGESSWTEIGHFSSDLHFEQQILALCVVGDYIYCIDERRWVKIYNMKSWDWEEKDMEIPPLNIFCCPIAEDKDGIVRMDTNYKYDNLKRKRKNTLSLDLTCYKLNEKKMEWEILCESDMKNRSWCLEKISSFLVKGKPRIYFNNGDLVVSDICHPIQNDTATRHLFTRGNNPIPGYSSRSSYKNLFLFDMD
ncbi:F-box/kelch-repeat protein At1g57790-like [Mercurialis annua]|uniref:F-box/kelch-repeat protein At1g57790-like n=1 Tax=Mercurialis annua TaxID=3986 RepID=UPI00215E4145|nr:F-box/kelch-repeat protein At1g57790-like [Mercurialis annua]